jgi:hypothetical protein
MRVGLVALLVFVAAYAAGRNVVDLREALRAGADLGRAR